MSSVYYRDLAHYIFLKLLSFLKELNLIEFKGIWSLIVGQLNMFRIIGTWQMSHGRCHKRLIHHRLKLYQILILQTSAKYCYKLF